MTSNELAKILRRKYGDALAGQKVTVIHLFGIEYADEIRACDTSPSELVCMAGLPRSYGTEVNKGCNLARFVRPRGGLS